MSRTEPPRRVAITGGRGFLGSALTQRLRNDGWRVQHLVRGEARPDREEIGWDPEKGSVDLVALEGVDAIVHLAGENIAGVWTPGKKRRIHESRAVGTRVIAEAAVRLERPPRTFVGASGVGYYGDGGEVVLTEESPPGDDFLAGVCQAWEAGAAPAREAGIRVVHSRFGLVLDPEGGALATMLPVFRLGVGGRLGSGRQWMSWVARADAVRALSFLLDRDDLSGPVNVTAPEPVRNETFTRKLASAVRRPALLAVPSFALRAFTGGMGESLLLVSQRAVPDVLDRHGFDFRTPAIGDFFAAGVDGPG